MLLRRVVYELFEWEVETVQTALAGGCHELNRQIRLEGADGSCVYIAWDWGRGQPDYFLSHAEKTFCIGPADVELDVSNCPTWQPLIDREVSVVYRDKGWQVIEVRSEERVVYCCAFQSDRVFVRLTPSW